ncbi:MAG: VOC family protein [Oceanococcus sp.]
MEFSAKTRACIFFGSEAEESAHFYVSVIPDSKIDNVVKPAPDAPALVVEFSLPQCRYALLNQVK